jgi:hypothetical protein
MNDGSEMELGIKLAVSPDRAAKTLKEALLLWLRRCDWGPAFHYFQGEKPEQELPGRFQIEP